MYSSENNRMTYGKIKSVFFEVYKRFLSEVISDIVKLFILSIVVMYSSKLIPFVNEVLEREYVLSIFYIIIYTCILIFITSGFLYLFLREKYKKIQADNQIDELTGVKKFQSFRIRNAKFRKQKE